MEKWNVYYFDEHGNCKQYLTDFVSSKEEAEKWRDEFNRRYRKPFPNRKGYYASAQIIRMP